MPERGFPKDAKIAGECELHETISAYPGTGFTGHLSAVVNRKALYGQDGEQRTTTERSVRLTRGVASYGGPTMKGLDLARDFYFDCLQPIIVRQTPDLREAHAAGLIGYGSDVLGNDDEFSRDHEWGPRLVLFLRDRDYSRFAEGLDLTLQNALPATFQGFPTRFERNPRLWNSLVMTTSAEGRHHVAITTVERFMKLTLGYRGVPETDFQWLLIPEQRLLEFTSGEIFYDGIGEITHARAKCCYFPDNVWRYRLSYVLESLGWELGLIPLCGKRGDSLSVRLNTAVTVERVMKLTFLVNRRYCPGYAKWLHREFSKLPIAAREIESLLAQALLTTDAVAIHSKISEALERLYVHLRVLDGVPELPSELPRVLDRSSTVDTQKVARIILDSISGPLGELSINGAACGAADQWVTNQDILISPEHVKSLASVYSATELERRRAEDVI